MSMREKRFSLTIKRSTLISFLLVVLFTVLAGGNTANPDIQNYTLGYNNNAAYYYTEGAWLYSWCQDVFIYLGASFEIFRLCMYFGGFVILDIANKKLTGGSPFFFIFYAVSLLLMDSTQTYNYIGMCFLILGTAYLISSERKNRLLFVFCLIIASGFHVVFAFYIPFVFIYSMTDTKQLTKLYVGVMVIILALSTVISLTGFASIVSQLLDVVGLDSYQGYLTSRTRYGHFLPMITHIVCCLFAFFYFVKATDRATDNKVERICFLFSLYGVFAFPFFRFQMTLSRLTRNLLLLSCISGINYSYNLSEKGRRNVKLLLFILACFLGYFVTYSNYMEEIVYPFFQNNWILGIGK